MSLKSTLLVAALGVSFLSPVFADNTSTGDWTGYYTIDTYDSSYEFTHTPDQVCLLSDHVNMCAGKGLTIGAHSFSNVTILVDTLEISTDMTQEEFEEALKRATGINTIVW